MHALPATDRRSWRKQAETHADFCHHGTLEFLPWHRHYLNQFEKICGELIGNADFALPYWDWTIVGGKIPDPFFDVANLNVTHWNDNGQYNAPHWGPGQINTIGIRAIDKGIGVQSDPQRGGSFTADRINSILDENEYSRFCRRLEGTPHNSGHVVVGFPVTGPTGHIGDGLSPLDPLFWLHHCNVDRLWAQWQMAGNTTPSFGGNYNGQFVDTSGSPVNLNADGAQDFTKLGYTYQQFSNPTSLLTLAQIVDPTSVHDNFLESFLPQNRLHNETVTIASVSTPTVVDIGIPTGVSVETPNLREQLSGTRTSLEVSLPSQATQFDEGLSTQMLATFGRPKKTPRRILARIKGAKASFAAPPVVNVFVNCPYLSPETAYTDVHYADTFSFFGSAKHGEGHAETEFVVDLTPALRKTDLESLSKLKVQFMALGRDGANALGSFEFATLELLGA